MSDVEKLKEQMKILKTKMVKDRAEGILDRANLCPEVGMGMTWQMAIYDAMHHYTFSREEVDYDALTKHKGA
jgi:hypothetical protein